MAVTYQSIFENNKKWVESKISQDPEYFHELAKKHSLCPSGKKGGDLGEFRAGQMVKPFDDVVFKKPLLEVHGPVKTQFGFHLIKTLYRS